MSFVIEWGHGPAVRYFSAKVGRNFGAPGAGWVSTTAEASQFETEAEALAHLERFLPFQAPDSRVVQHVAAPAPAAAAPDHYATLGLGRGASAVEIRSAYRALAMQHHPDRGGDAERFKEIAEAYAVLVDAEKRAAYNAAGCK